MKRQASDAAHREAAREKILDATVRSLKQTPAAGLTVEAVAREAGCAKGLVHYHFKTKSALFAAAADRLWSARAQNWKSALGGQDPQAAIARGWELARTEATDGIDKACASLGTLDDELVDRAVRNGFSAFAEALGGAADTLFAAVGLTFTVPPAEIGRLAAAVILGLGPQLSADPAEPAMEGAYSAFWAGMLSMTRAR